MSLLRLGRPNPEEVFTPRKPLNEGMYVERRVLKERFDRALRGNQHIAIFGDSGNGKTWLYQKVLKKNKIPYVLVDLAVAQTDGMDHAFRAALENPYGWIEDTKVETRSGGVDAYVKAEKSRETQYTFADKPPFEKVVDELAKKNKRAKFIVFDNLESVSEDSELLKKLASYIIRLDNPRFVASGVRFLFVGVVTDMKKLFSGSTRAETISNRIYELPEVRRLTRYEAETVFRTGFFDKLKLDFGEAEDVIVQSCVYYSGQTAQQVHEIGLNVAFEAEKK